MKTARHRPIRILIMSILLPFACLTTHASGVDSNFDLFLKRELLANHQRHVPLVTIHGSEVKLTYGPELEWSKSSDHDDVARIDALDCFKADYAAASREPNHRLHDYFHVINYSTWSHQVIGEATLKRSEYPSAESVDREIARTLDQWRKKVLARSPE